MGSPEVRGAHGVCVACLCQAQSDIPPQRELKIEKGLARPFLSRCVFYIMGRAIVIAVILQSDPSIKMYMGLRAGKQQKPRTYTHPIRHIRESEIVTQA
jgi:hypothetical protein